MAQTQFQFDVLMADKGEYVAAFRNLLAELVLTIADDYRAFDDSDTPSMQVTFGMDEDGAWTYQTGDNSFSGPCYSMPFWGVVYLTQDSTPEDLEEMAGDAFEEITDQMPHSALRRWFPMMYPV